MMRLEPAREINETTEAMLASGRADPAIALFLDCVLDMRRAADPTAAALAGAVLESETPVEMRTDALERALAAIEAGVGRPAKTARATDIYPELIQVPDALRETIRRAEETSGWRSAMPGIRQLPLDMGGTVKAEIMRISPGAATPRHTHKGREATLCLVGGFSDHRGSYGPGDVALADSGVTHQPRGDADGVCFVLAVTDGDLKFEGAIGLIQKLFGG
jgi:putative transcriptional regulator